MITVTKRFEFDAAHRLLGYDGKCANIHGHRYVVEVEVGCASSEDGEKLDGQGMIVDFKFLDALIGTWLDDNWDHALLLKRDDPFAMILDGQTRTFLFHGVNPTAEVMAGYLGEQIDGMLDGLTVALRRVRVYETPDSFAEVKA